MHEKITTMIALLPKYVLLNLLKEWMFLVEIGKLDSALCNVENRQFFQHWDYIHPFFTPVREGRGWRMDRKEGISVTGVLI